MQGYFLWNAISSLAVRQHGKAFFSFEDQFIDQLNILSSKNIAMTDLLEISKRIKKVSGVKRNKEVAELIGISASNFSSQWKKNSDTLFRNFMEWGLKNGINLNWLATGYGFPYLEDKNQNGSKEEILKATINFLQSAIEKDNIEIKLELNKKNWEDLEKFE